MTMHEAGDVKSSAIKVTTLAYALQAAFEAWAAEAPLRGKIEERARMQVHRELGALTVRLEQLVEARLPNDGGMTPQK